MKIEEGLLKKELKLAVVGLGYVGMPIAVEFAKYVNVIGFDNNKEKIQIYLNGIDPTEEVGNDEIANSNVYFTSDEEKLKEASFIIVAVPTPVNLDKTPDLTPVISASQIIGRNLKKGAIVVYESTVYPGVTEDICVPILEEESKMVCGKDFKIGYSPERINPGDKEHRLESIIKIVSGMDSQTAKDIGKVYEIVIKAGVHLASTIKVAEAAKVVENSQRDINIAFMNELAMAFDKMGINTSEVIDAMNTKWNALKFYPGLVGGHCIGVDPYYFIYQAEKLGFHSQIVAAGRKVNDGMAEFIANSVIKQLILAKSDVRNCKVAILGMTFKENCPDTRNSKVLDIIDYLKEYNINPLVVDTEADPKLVKRETNIDLVEWDSLIDLDCAIFAVPHNSIKSKSLDEIIKKLKFDDHAKPVVIDIKSILDKDKLLECGCLYWSL